MDDSDIPLDVGSVGLGRYFKANHSISDADRGTLRIVLGRAEAEIKAIDTKITLLQQRKEILLSFQNTHIALLSRIRSLPTELLSLIFSFCVSERNLVPLYEAHEAPWNLGHVCQKWRHVVLSTSSLWAHLEINNTFMRYYWHGGRSVRPQRACFPVLKQSIQNSADHPLSVKFMEDTSAKSADSRTEIDLLALVVRNCDRLVAFEVPVHRTELIPILNRARGHLDSLRRCTLDFYTLSWHGNVLNAFEIAPHLTELHLRSPPVIEPESSLISLPLLPMPWAQLRELSLMHARLMDARAYLQMTPSLEHLTLIHCYEENEDFVERGTSASFVHENLRMLRFIGSGKMIRSASFPRLNTYGTPCCSGFVSICNFLLPSQAALRRLDLGLHDLEMGDYEENVFHPIFSAAAPFLEHLSIVFNKMAPDLFKQIIHILTIGERHSDQATIPRLVSLDLVLWNVGETFVLLDTAFVEMLESRWQYSVAHPETDGVANLFQATVEFEGEEESTTFLELTPDNCRRLKVLIEQGMMLSIKARGERGMSLGFHT